MRVAGIVTFVVAGIFLLGAGVTQEETRLCVAGIAMVAIAAIIPPRNRQQG